MAIYNLPPASVAQAEILATQARSRIVDAVLAGAKLHEALHAEMQRCRAAWTDLDAIWPSTPCAKPPRH